MSAAENRTNVIMLHRIPFCILLPLPVPDRRGVVSPTIFICVDRYQINWHSCWAIAKQTARPVPFSFPIKTINDVIDQERSHKRMTNPANAAREKSTVDSTLRLRMEGGGVLR